MAVTIKKITELPVGTPEAGNDFIFGVGDNAFRVEYDTLKTLFNEAFIEDLSFPVLETNVTHEINSTVNPLANVDLTIVAGEVYFIRLNVIDENDILGRDTYIVGLGAGVYQPLGVTIGYDDLIRVDRKPTSVTSGDANTVTYTVADLNEINTADPSFDFSDTNLIYFIELDGVLYRFTGTNGLYGTNDLTMTLNDLNLVSVLEPELWEADPNDSNWIRPIGGKKVNKTHIANLDLENTTIPTGGHTLQASDIDKFLVITAPNTIVVPNGLAENLEFQGVQSGAGVVDFVAESGGTLNVNAAFQAILEGDHAFFGVRTFGSDEAGLTGTLKLA